MISKNLFLIICLIIIYLLIQIIILNKRYSKLLKKNRENCKEKLKYQTKLSMIEFWVRNYKEGENIYTVFRDISNALKSEIEE